MNFFVIGLPRSRTAWLANFLTQEKFCYHEGLNGCHTVTEYKQKLSNDKGDSSTALMLLEMNTLFPDSPKLIIHGDKQKAVDYSYKTYGFYDPSYIDHLESRMNEIEGWHLSVEQIDIQLEKIWQYLIGEGFNRERAEQLKNMRVEIKNPHSFDEVAMNIFIRNELCNLENLI